MLRIFSSLLLSLQIGLSVAAADNLPIQNNEYQQHVEYIVQFKANQEDLVSEIHKSEGESKLSLELRRIQYQRNYIEHIEQLVGFLIRQKQQGVDIDAMLTPVQPYLLRLGPAIHNFIQIKNDNFENAKASLDDLSDEYILQLSQHLEVTNLALSSLAQHIDNLSALGLDNDTSTEFLHRALIARVERLSGQEQINKIKNKTLENRLELNNTDNKLEKQLSNSHEKISLITDSLRITINLMDGANLDTTEYRRILIESTGKLSSDILDRAVFAQLVQRWSKKLLNYIEHNAVDFIFNAFVFIGIIIIFMLMAKLIQSILRKSFNASKNQSTLLEAMLTTLICRSIIFIGILIALAQLGISLGPLLAGLGIAGFIIGFALQDTLGNFASGIMIIFYRPYDVGDMIEVGGVYGQVESMNLVSSTILTIDNQTLVMPNSKIWGDVIKNVTHQKTRRVDMEFHTLVTEDVDSMLELFKDIINKHSLTLSKPEPLIRLSKIERDSLVFIVKPWVKTVDYWNVYWDIQEAVKRRFDAEGISLPSHQITVQQA